MNRFYKVSSKYSYYKYLEKYDAAFLRKYQSETHFYLGRRYAKYVEWIFCERNKMDSSWEEWMLNVGGEWSILEIKERKTTDDVCFWLWLLFFLLEVLGRTSWLSTLVTISPWKKSTTSNTRLTCHLYSWVTDSHGCSLLMCSSTTTSFWAILVRASTLVSGIIVSSHLQRETILLVMSLSTSLIELKNGDLKDRAGSIGVLSSKLIHTNLLVQSVCVL